jgi:hypothetical protein
MSNLTEMSRVRAVAALAANAEDASIWRWFAPLLEERRIRWCYSGESWFVSVDNKHVATETSFDNAIRAAREATQRSRQPLS